MTKLNWDRVNMENLAARREAEFQNRFAKTEREKVGLGERLKRLGSRVARTFSRRVKTSTIPLPPLSPLTCARCGNVMAASSMAKHLRKKHRGEPPPAIIINAKEPNSRKLKKKNATSVLLKPQNPEVADPTPKKKKKKKGRDRRRNVVDIIYLTQHRELAQRTAIQLGQDDLSVRLIESSARGKKTYSVRAIKWFVKSQDDDARIARLNEKILFLETDPEITRTKHDGSPLGVIYLCGSNKRTIAK